MHKKQFIPVGAVLLAACTDYGFNTPGEKSPPGQTDTASVDTGPVSNPPEEEEPEEEPPGWIEDCDDGIEIEMSPDEIYVVAWEPSQATGTLHAPSSGWYHIYDHALSESGASQRNESVYLRIPNVDHPDGKAMFKNCDSEWIVLDADNQGAPSTTSRQYMGTFWLVEGANEVQLNHYCPLYRSGQCGSFHNADVEDSTCDAGNGNSAHLTGTGVCMKPL